MDTDVGDLLGRAWHRAVTEQPPPDDLTLAVTFAVALALVAAPGTWPLVRHVVTIVHEGAHGLAAWATGRELAGIRLHSDTSGVTVSRGPARGPGMVATAAAGYPGPALLGLLCAWLLSTGHAIGSLWVLLVLLALLLLQIRNLFGLWSVLVSAAALVAVTWWVPERGQAAVAATICWFLLLAATRPVLELQAMRSRGRAGDSDADQLARLTGVPGLVWVGLFLLVSAGCLLVGGWLLLGPLR